VIGLIGAKCSRPDGAGLLEAWEVRPIGFSAAMAEEVTEAVRWLEGAGGIYFTSTGAPSRYTNRLLYIENVDPWAEGPRGVHAFTLQGDEYTSIGVFGSWARLTFAAARENLIRHELLHALGFEHTSNPLSLMHPQVGWWPVRRGLLPGEREELRRVYG
jgi:hypothetical protein